MIVRLTQIDGKLPNLALMKLAHCHRERGDEIHFTKHVERDMLKPTTIASTARRSSRSAPSGWRGSA